MATGSRTLGAVLTAIAVIVLIVGTIIAINTYNNRRTSVDSVSPPPVPVVTEAPRAVPVGGVATGGGGTATDGGVGVTALAVAGALAVMLTAGTALALQRRTA